LFYPNHHQQKEDGMMSFHGSKAFPVLRRFGLWSFCAVAFLWAGCSNVALPVQPSVEESATVAQAPVVAVPIHLKQIPPQWNGDVIVYAHGFTAPGLPVDLAPETPLFLQFALSQGFGFAATSYPDNGMVVQEGLADVVALVREFKTEYPTASHFYLIGASLGGLIATKAAEQYPDLFSGVLAMAGPYGDFVVETNYIGDVLTVFNYYFPGVLPCTPVQIPVEVMMQWQSVYMPAVIATITNPANADKVRQLLAVTKVPVDPVNPQTIVESIVGVLFFNVFATMDVQGRLGGQAYSNTYKRYCGSDDDAALNKGVQRYKADAKALVMAEKRFGTTGAIKMPVVTMHTTGDYIVPIRQQLLYRLKVAVQGKTRLYAGLPIVQYGHATFTPEQVAAGFQLLLQKTQMQPVCSRK
jgi:pimeloyl-ACP methyl ester carboxylesterase